MQINNDNITFNVIFHTEQIQKYICNEINGNLKYELHIVFLIS